MCRNSNISSGKWIYAALQFTIILILALALNLGSAGRATLVQAAPRAQGTGSQYETKYLMAIYVSDNQEICAGQDFPIRVRLVESTQQLEPKPSKPEPSIKYLSGRTIQAFAKDESIGTLSPRKLITGWALDQDAPGEATFTFHAKKAGTTNLYFETLIRKAITGTVDEYIGPVRTIKVINCKYELTMNYLMRQSSGGTTGLIMGHMDTLVEGDGQAYQGTGVLHTDRTETMAPCSFSSAGFDNPATITGKLTGSPDHQQLEVTVDYGPGESSATITCPIVGARTTTTTEDPTNWLAANATFLGTGGAQSFPIDFAQWFGRLIITVKPVEGSS
jgi:hypothetical protein